MSTTAIESTIDQFEYIPGYRIFVCKEHRYGLRDLKRHLLEYYSLTHEARDAIVERYASLAIVALEEASLPTDRVRPFDCLRELSKIPDGIQ
jgi:hypothetical protein